MPAVIDNNDGHGPLIVLCFGAGGGEDLADLDLAQYGFTLHGNGSKG
jgi:hypothetical protein